jgi:hypothetical protein
MKNKLSNFYLALERGEKPNGFFVRTAHISTLFSRLASFF